MRLIWSQTVPDPPRGLLLARERETILAWDGRERLYLFNHAGTLQAQRTLPSAIAAAGCAEDGSAYAVAAAQPPLICWLAPDLTTRWQRALPQRATALAVEPLGRCVAVADASGTLHLIDARGRTLWQATTPRPLHHLAFVTEKQVLVGASDFGLVVCFGASGECLWRDGLVAHVGSLSVNGDGSCVVLPCFSDGLVRYSTASPEQQRISLGTPCHLAAVSYAGDCLLTADCQVAGGTPALLCLRRDNGDIRDRVSLDAPATAIALGARGDFALVGLANGAILRFEEQSASGAA
ncbi:MAG: outer membrane protein assembly factor BamB family protein [Gemmataceae bacterium]